MNDADFLVGVFLGQGIALTCIGLTWGFFWGTYHERKARERREAAAKEAEAERRRNMVPPVAKMPQGWRDPASGQIYYDIPDNGPHIMRAIIYDAWGKQIKLERVAPPVRESLLERSADPRRKDDPNPPMLG